MTGFVDSLSVLIKFVSDNNSLKTATNEARKALRVVDDYSKNSGAFSSFADSLKRSVKTGFVEGLVQGIKEANAKLARQQWQDRYNNNAFGMGKGGIMSGGVGRVIGIAAGALSLKQMGSVADTWATIEARVGMVTDNINEQKETLDQLFKNAQNSGQSYEAVAGVYTSIARNKNDLGLSNAQAIDLTDIISKAMAIGGGSAESQQAALIQLNQALGSGVLRGEELNSILEQAPRLAQAIAEAFNVPIGQLRTLGAQGKLTSAELAEGLLKQSEKINAELELMPKTFARAKTIAINKLNEIINKYFKLADVQELVYAITSKTLPHLEKMVVLIGGGVMISGLTKVHRLWVRTQSTIRAINTLLRVQLGLQSAMTLRWNAAALSYAKSLRSIKALTLSMAKMALLFYGVYLISEDIYTWWAGGKSVLGEMVGSSDEIKKSLIAWKEQLSEILNKLGLSEETLNGIGTFLKGNGGAMLAMAAAMAVTLKVAGLILSPFIKLFSLLGGFRAIGAIFAKLARFAGLIAGGVKIIAAVLGISVGWAAALIAAVVAAAIAIVYYWEDIKKWALETWEEIKKKADEMWEGVKAKANEIWASVTTTIGSMWDSAITSASDTWKRIKEIIVEWIDKAVNEAIGFIKKLNPFNEEGFIQTTVRGALEPFGWDLRKTIPMSEVNSRAMSYEDNSTTYMSISGVTDPAKAAANMLRTQNNLQNINAKWAGVEK